MALASIAILVAFLAVPFEPARALPGTVRLNQMQVIGSHNSFHVEPPPDLLQIMIGVDPQAIELAYTHPPLPDQFQNQGVRQIELDIYADPNGDLWRPIGTKGYKVFHIEGLDERSTCETLVACLDAVKGWSDAHPSHMPIMIMLEIHDTCDVCGPPDPLFVDSALFDQMDAELNSVFPADRVLTPDDVRGSHATLREAVTTDGWPLIDSLRGQVMFTLDNKHDDYAAGHASLSGRVAFAPANDPADDDAAFLKRNDPTGANQAEITALVQAGFVVRTRADNPVTTAQSGDTSQRDAALASGAQWVSTDYPVPGLSARWGTDYVASIPGGTPARCNPVNAPAGCVNTDIENLPPTPTTTTTAAVTTVPARVVAVPLTAVPRFTG